MALHSLRFAPRSLTLRLRARYACSGRAQRGWAAGGASPYVLACLGALGLVLHLCGTTLAQRVSPPEAVFGDAIYGLCRKPGTTTPVDTTTSICFRLNQIARETRSGGTQDLVDRCNDLAPTQQNEALRQISPEEIGTLG